MRKHLLLVGAVVLAAACSSPKYTYHFDHYDYNSGKKKIQPAATVQESAVASVATPQDEAIVAPAEFITAETGDLTPTVDAQKAAADLAKTYKSMTKEEKKAFRKEAKAQIKQYVKAVKSGDEGQIAAAKQAMDKDLKLAAIFGAVGIVALLIGGDVFWIVGGIALLIGVVFFIMWLVRQ
jgi:hypothetical protein